MKEKNLVIGVSGGSGSGKTTFVNALRDNLKDQRVCFLSLDNYYLPRDKQEVDSAGYKNFDLPESIDIKALINDLETLMSGTDVPRTEYTFNNSKSVKREIILVPADVYIIEGLFIYHYPELKKFFDLKLFVDAKDVLKVIRRIERDRIERNYPITDVAYRYQNHVLPSYEQYIGVYKDDCDIVINNNDTFRRSLMVITSYIKDFLSSC
jgi:uridine kinase